MVKGYASLVICPCCGKEWLVFSGQPPAECECGELLYPPVTPTPKAGEAA